jgi:catechol 2,3-dioxygenase-like lactoylglutathione lyase family enzyme
MQEQFQRPLLSPTTRGIHHLALCTDDMKATIDFYVEVLGMPLVRGNPPYEEVRHYFFDMGLSWRKASGAQLAMVWRCEQGWERINGWHNFGFEELIRVEITPASQ